jgi:excinuclease ABC subunit A
MMISEIYFQRKYHKYEDICKAFSFNVDGGRETCKEGSINVEWSLWLMFTLWNLPMENDLKKFLVYFNKNIHDILTMTIDDAVAFW